jgi:hypothetical protein
MCYKYAMRISRVAYFSLVAYILSASPVLAHTFNFAPAQALDYSPQHFLSVTGEYLFMGMLHIWTGYDHILFLLSVILLLRSFKKIFLLVTSFTIAHSITLILVSYYFVFIPPIFVEPLIALSIVYVAGRNIWLIKKKEEASNIGERWVSTFFFGLIHGLGFAGALLATDIPQEFFLPSLVVFNVGIEVGQFSILAVAIPLLFWLDKQVYARKVLTIFSAVICVLAVFWVVERVSFFHFPGIL